jgi:pimeloyl-ACP methyl ester carboxylesterase
VRTWPLPGETGSGSVMPRHSAATTNRVVPSGPVFGALDRRWRSSSGAEYDLAPEADVEMIPGVGHSPMIEAPGRTGQMLGDFIATVTGQDRGGN